MFIAVALMAIAGRAGVAAPLAQVLPLPHHVEAEEEQHVEGAERTGSHHEQDDDDDDDVSLVSFIASEISVFKSDVQPAKRVRFRGSGPDGGSAASAAAERIGVSALALSSVVPAASA
mmetsp:Transcript_88545/g.253564  ORF Transcript_88545/g.253564 Transcript_88545/m.253564 type:complete len:118 (-) Transcript_88545:426-779(-)